MEKLTQTFFYIWSSFCEKSVQLVGKRPVSVREVLDRFARTSRQRCKLCLKFLFLCIEINNILMYGRPYLEIFEAW